MSTNNPTAGLALRLAQSLAGRGAVELEPVVETYDPAALAYLKFAGLRAFGPVWSATKQSHARILAWCLAGGHEARMALLVLTGAVGEGVARVPDALRPSFDRPRVDAGYFGGRRVSFVHDRRTVAFLDGEDPSWRSDVLTERATTVAELVEDTRLRDRPLAFTTLRRATALGVLLPGERRRLIDDAIRRDLLADPTPIPQLETAQLKALSMLAVVLGPELRGAVAGADGALVFAELALQTDGTLASH